MWLLCNLRLNPGSAVTFNFHVSIHSRLLIMSFSIFLKLNARISWIGVSWFFFITLIWNLEVERYHIAWCESTDFKAQEIFVDSYVSPAAAAAAAKSLHSCPTLWDPIDGSPSGSPIPGILQARTLEWVAISFSKAWKWKVKVKSLSCVRLFMTPWTAAHQAPPSMGFSRQEYWSGVPLPSLSCYPAAAKSLQSCLTLCDPIDGSPPGSLVPGILQARVLEWVAIIAFSVWSRWGKKKISLQHFRSHAMKSKGLLNPPFQFMYCLYFLFCDTFME